jgi:hypothetical protein
MAAIARPEGPSTVRTGYYVPKGAEEATRQGVAAWQKLQKRLRELAELNKERNLRRAHEADT